jgi:hypothetical protein
LVEKRTFVFVVLATIVWAALASTSAGYFYLQYTRNIEQLNNAEDSLGRIASNYAEATNKYDSLLSDYASLSGNYSFSTKSNYITLMPLMGGLIADFGKNYTDLLTQQDINQTYIQLLGDYQKLLQNATVAKADFGNLLSEYYDLFSLSALREQELTVSEATTLSVNIVIDYGNGTVTWHNQTMVTAASNLFELTLKIAVIRYQYYALGPGHEFVTSINGKAETSAYSWFWYYWNSGEREWVKGPSGCDAWLLKDGGLYKWSYESW